MKGPTDLTFFPIYEVLLPIEKTPQATEELSQSIEERSQAIEERSQAIEERSQAIEERPQAIEECPQAIEECPQAIEECPQAIEEPSQAIEDGRNQLRNARKLLRNPRKRLRNARKQLRNARKQLRNARKPLRNARKPLRNARKPLRNARKPLRNARKPLRNARKLLRNARKPLSQWVADFTHTPPKPVDAKHAATLNKANAAIEGLGGKQAIQLAGEHGHKTEDLRGDRGDVEAMLRKINKTMASIANEKKQPGLMDRFRMPHGTSDSVLAGKLVAFANAIDEQGLLDELAEHNLVLSTDALRLFAEDFKETGADQSLARGKQTGATASIPELLKTLRECKKTWDAIYHNTYEGNTEMLTAWRSASHVERNGAGRTAGKASPPPVPN